MTAPASRYQPITETPRHTPAPDDYVIRKGGFYYRPNAEGYCSDILEAGRWSHAEALSHQKGVEGVTIHLFRDRYSPLREKARDAEIATLTARVEELEASTSLVTFNEACKRIEQLEKALRLSAPAGNDGVNCDCGFSAADCRTNPCYRKKVATSGLAPDASYPYCGDDAAQPREAEPVTPITNPLVLPAGIKAGDYASSSPIPEAPTIDSTPSCGQENDYRRAQGSIPDAPGGIPNYEFPYQQTFDAIAAATEIYPSKEQALGFSISVRKFQEAFNNHRDHRALKPQDGGKCEHGIAKVNCGICIPSEVFSGRSGR